jgi:hypothetical protein
MGTCGRAPAPRRCPNLFVGQGAVAYVGQGAVRVPGALRVVGALPALQPDVE